MDNTAVSSLEDNWGKEGLLRKLEDEKDTSGDDGMNCSELKSKKLGSLVNPHHALILNVRRIQAYDSLLGATFCIQNEIPRHVITLDEKYLRCCLELIHINAAKAAQCSISNLSSVKLAILSDGPSSSTIGDGNTCDFGMFVYKCPPEVETDNLAIGSAEPWVVGSVMGSNSMANILKSALLNKLGAFNVDPSSYDVKLGSETPLSDNHKNGSETERERLFSMSSISSTCLRDQSFSYTSTAISQGMLQCTWEGGIPYFVFSVANQREVYVANMSKEAAARNKGLDYVYLFHSSKSSHKEHRISDNESHLVGKMTVCTSFSICPQDSKIMETEFVLFSGNRAFVREIQTSGDNHRKNKGPSKKVVEAFKNSHSSKQRTASRFRRSSSIIEYSSPDPCRDTVNNSGALDQTNLLDEQLPANLELTAIVVRDHCPENPRTKVRGWGLKFLEKPVVEQNVDTLEARVGSRNTGDCSTSMNVLIPAGIHGGPRTKNGGPSSLIKRWRSGGHCDCGGWDIGCPLTIFKSRSSKGDSSPTDIPEACKLFDFSIQGPDHGSPALTISSVRDGLYFIDFQSTLSALQSFSIAVAYIHTQSPSLRHKMNSGQGI